MLLTHHFVQKRKNLKLEKLTNNNFNSNGAAYADLDNDGDLDVFVGTRLIPGKYTYPATSYLLINESGNFKKASTEISQALNNIGMVTDAVFTDIDGVLNTINRNQWNKTSIDLYNKLCHEFNLKPVISSTWREL